MIASINFFAKNALSQSMVCLPANKSSSAPEKYAIAPMARGRNKIFIVIAPTKSSCIAKTTERVRPQPEHGNPVTSLKMQGMEKGVAKANKAAATPKLYINNIFFARSLLQWELVISCCYMTQMLHQQLVVVVSCAAADDEHVNYPPNAAPTTC